MVEKDKRISNELDVSDSDEEDDGDGEKKRNSQNYKKRVGEKTGEPNGVHKDSPMDVTEKKEDRNEAKCRKMDTEMTEKPAEESKDEVKA